ncbi:MAG: hypothetical protein Kow001_13750 [Acidobacteriota bacterium]
MEEALVIRISPDLPEDRWRGILARLKLELPFYSQYPPQFRVPAATAVRSGLGTYLAVLHGFAKGPEDTFPTWSAEGVGSLSELAPRVRRALRDPTLARNVPKEVLVTVGMGFARQVCESYPVAELLGMSQDKLSGLFWAYLDAFADPPAGAGHVTKPSGS